jgi:hypothetical protein
MVRQDLSTNWRVTITEVIGIFRDALCALVPHAERARMPWRESEAYDDWDRIARALFESFVLDTLRWGLPGDKGHLLRMPTYDVGVENYSGWSTLALSSSSGRSPLPGEVLAFRSLVSAGEPFDTVRAILVSREPFGRAGGEIRVPLAGAAFCLLICDAHGGVERYADLEVVL